MTNNISSKTRIWLILILGTISATGPLSIDMYLPALPEMTKDFASPASLIQLSLSSCLIGLALGQIIVGPLSDKFGRKIPLITGFTIFAIVSLILSFSNSVSVLIILRFIQGLAGATGQVLSKAIARDLFSGPLLTTFYSMLSAVNGIFPVVSPVIGGIIIKFFKWQVIFIILAAIGFLIVLAVLCGIKETLPPDKRVNEGVIETFASMGQLLTNWPFMKLLLSAGLVTGGLFCYISASSFVFQQLFHMSVQNFSFLYAVNGTGIAIGSVIPGFLASRTSLQKQTKVVLGTTVASATLLVISALAFHNLAVVIALVLLIVTQFGMLFTLTTSIVMNLSTNNSGSISALFGLSQNGIGGIMSPVMGMFGTMTYMPMAVGIFGCLGLSFLLFNSAEKKISNN
ncbi:multidrug effflux MFS transporter [Lentilactobacillus sp. Marseille-Q4993]|uniref:multidrug effflux MFS transporter n=1 Tax=Lentilactobacillus sp. Marseille-Q4993 TaxID=3039492 RepID=UPI0024BC7FAA|nr:multidrug effflux MFS transporter [Lentilactobacillus sp. Marseille-Q4993]